MRVFFSFLLCIAALDSGFAAAADYVIIVNPNSGVERLSKDEVISIFMGRQRKLTSGVTALPVDLAGPPAAKEQFYASLVGKKLSEVNSYWARVMFSGQGSPPRQAESEDEVVEIVASSKGAIGYIDRKKLNKQVKAVFNLTN
ncbi:hypothetical protein [Noviherbaspirillum saxi]|uniref:Phosphate ABC transporter substrate-binding protein n=1 Tax=Noviherbaspirillum saxi TaxID=2320863 RepID=A0A3A3FFN7_9BURK|nr:hypothetical protein [Noviherbaspirillum saxi]RJF91877.1 hypothetical protein D3871_24680 [Noviherbaspirillum saxi]